MPRKNSGGKNGRPFSKIDWKHVEFSIRAGCPSDQIAQELGISLDTLYNRCMDDNGVSYSEYRQSKKMRGLNLLRRTQFQKAIEGNTSMLTLLGVEMLGQGQKKGEGEFQNLSDLAEAERDGKIDEILSQPDGP